MTTFVDLSHTFEDGMPGFTMTDDAGTAVEYTAEVRPFLTHEQSAPFYAEGCSFEISELRFQTSIGTYLDSPAHRYEGRRDVSDLDVEELVLPGVVVDVTGREAWEAVGPEVLDGVDVAGKAVLFHFGWDAHWGTGRYDAYPFVSPALVDRLVADEAALVGVDTLNVDDSNDPARPTHTRLLDEEILVVENLTGLDALLGASFRFFGVPLKAREVVAMPIRAFAELS